MGTFSPAKTGDFFAAVNTPKWVDDLVSLSGMVETPRLQAKKSYKLSPCDFISFAPILKQI
jgi:hypothetical protein